MPKFRSKNPEPDEIITLTATGRVYNLVAQQQRQMEAALNKHVSMTDALETLMYGLFDNCAEEFAARFELTGTNALVPSVVPPFQAKSIVVYGRNTGWTDEESTADEDKAGWPFMCGKEGEYTVERVIWDQDTETLVVIVDD